MTTRNLALAIALSGMIVTGMLIGQSTTSTESEYEWDMISQHVAGTGGGGSSGTGSVSIGGGEAVHGYVFLFNRKTGKVYRFWGDCGDDGANGCLEPLPTVTLSSTVTVTPEATRGAQAYQPQ